MEDNKTGLNKTFFIKEYPHITEIMSNSMQGLIESIYYLRDNNYELDLQPCRIIGIQNYLFAHKSDKDSCTDVTDNITPEMKIKQNQQIIELTFERDSMAETIEDYDNIIDSKDKDIFKLAIDFKDLKKENTVLKSQNTKLRNKYEKKAK